MSVELSHTCQDLLLLCEDTFFPDQLETAKEAIAKATGVGQ